MTYEEIAAAGDIDADAALGFHIPGRFDKVLDIRECWLQPAPSNEIRLETKRFCREHGYASYDIREHRGLMRNLVVRTSSTGEVMVIVVFGEEDRARIGALLDHLKERFPEITSLMYMVNTKAERLDGRHRRPPVERPRPHLRGDGGAAFQDRPEVVLPDQLRTGLRGSTRWPAVSRG